MEIGIWGLFAIRLLLTSSWDSIWGEDDGGVFLKCWSIYSDEGKFTVDFNAISGGSMYIFFSYFQY